MNLRSQQTGASNQSWLEVCDCAALFWRTKLGFSDPGTDPAFMVLKRISAN